MIDTTHEEEDTRPKRPGLFTSHATGTIAALSVTCSALGLAALGLEIAMVRMIDAPPLGVMLGLPIPFISVPLGVGALVIAAITAALQPRHSIVPWLSAVVYWAVLLWVWP